MIPNDQQAMKCESDPLRSASKATLQRQQKPRKQEGLQDPEGRPEGHVLQRRRPLTNPLGFNFA